MFLGGQKSQIANPNFDFFFCAKRFKGDTRRDYGNSGACFICMTPKQKQFPLYPVYARVQLIAAPGLKLYPYEQITPQLSRTKSFKHLTNPYQPVPFSYQDHLVGWQWPSVVVYSCCCCVVDCCLFPEIIFGVSL
jgi:hypothetical protein